MIFKASRIILFLIILGFTIYKIKKSKKWLYFVICFICSIVISLITVFPIENLFIDFQTPESVFAYYHAGKIIDVEYGNQTCMIVGSKLDNTDAQLLIPKTEKGYKIPNSYAKKFVSRKFDSNGAYVVYNLKDTTDYYLFSTIVTDHENITITDSNKKQIDTIITEIPNSDYKIIYICSFIDNYTDNYSITINGKTITLEPTKKAVIATSNTELNPNSD